MKYASILIMLILCLNLAATSMVIERQDQARIIIPVDTIDSLYFSNDTVGEVAQLQFVMQEPPEYPNDPVIIYIELVDINGNLVLESHPVTLSFATVPPDMVNINDMVYTIYDSTAVNSVDGVVTASLNPGNVEGVVTIRATVEVNGNTITATCQYAIHMMAIEGFYLWIGDAGYNIGGGNWALPVAAVLTTADGVLVPDGIPVSFSIGDYGNDWANIEESAYTGNSCSYAGPTPGYAYTILTYDGSYSMLPLTINISAGGLTAPIISYLPINQPQMEAIPMPGHPDFVFDEDTHYFSCDFLMNVTDGQGNPIRNAIIQMTSTHGTFQEPDEEYQVPNGDWSRLLTNEEGVAIGTILFTEEDCPPVDDPPNEVPVEMTFNLYGTDVTESVTFTLRNYNELE